LAAASTDFAIAHGDESHDALSRRNDHMAHSRRALEKCSEKLRSRDRIAQRYAKRNEMIDQHLSKRKLNKRDGFNLNPALAKRDLTTVVDLESLFPAEPECLLAPELTIGPYFAPEQLIRPDIREDREGVEFLVALQIIDVNTCETVPGVMVDFWHCDAAGTYSAFAGEGTAVSKPWPFSGETFNRGLQASDDNGIVGITTIFPGWYQGRATHIHIASHIGGSVTAGGFLANGTTTHIGQLFFPEDVLSTFDTLEPYNANSVVRLKNAADGIYNQQKTALGRDEVTTIHWIEEGTPQSGLVSTLVIGIDLTKSYSTTMGGGGSGGPGGAPGGSP
ncbi:Intradiol ring-cleavage dioxygenase, partial [Peziza echinospora]